MVIVCTSPAVVYDCEKADAPVDERTTVAPAINALVQRTDPKRMYFLCVAVLKIVFTD